MCIVAEAVDAAEAISKARMLEPDVVLLDVTMPGLSSFEASRLILEQVPRKTASCLAVCDEEEHFRAAMAAGASGYVLKDSPPSQIVAAVREIFRGASQLTPRGISRRQRSSSTRSGEPTLDSERAFDTTRKRDTQIAYAGRHGPGHR